MEIKIAIEGMGCPRCEAKVKKALEALPQVTEATASHTEKNAVVSATAPISMEEAVAAINPLGFTVTGVC